MTLTIMIALGACVLIVVMLAVAFVLPPVDDESIVKASQSQNVEPRSPRREVTIRRSGTVPALKDAPGARTTPETRTKPAGKPAQRPAWREITEASTTSRRKLSHALLYFGAWRSRRGLEAGRAGRVAAGVVVLSVALGYLIAHI